MKHRLIRVAALAPAVSCGHPGQPQRILGIAENLIAAQRIGA